MKMKQFIRVFLLLLLAIQLGVAAIPDGVWVASDGKGGIVRLKIEGTRLLLRLRGGTVERFDTERVGGALVFFHPRRGRHGALVTLRRVSGNRLRMRIRPLIGGGRLGHARYHLFRLQSVSEWHVYQGEWILRGNLPEVPVRIRIGKQEGYPYIEAWERIGGSERLIVRKRGYWDGRRIVLNWPDRRGKSRRAFIEGEKRNGRGEYRRIRIRLEDPHHGRTRVYRLERMR